MMKHARARSMVPTAPAAPCGILFVHYSNVTHMHPSLGFRFAGDADL